MARNHNSSNGDNKKSQEPQKNKATKESYKVLPANQRGWLPLEGC